ncbi:MAG TPA: hypothetical protein VMF08_00060 [Candidatus Sulfotelmatobacter sp.]|nr:hypothetical protein [Candidatus Sulfotelmatobacter sp.]
MKIGTIALAFATLLTFDAHVSTVLAQGATAFTYQGQLRNSGTNVTGTSGLIFALYNSSVGGSEIGAPITNNVAVTNGLFTVNLDFGAGAFSGSACWLDITVSNLPVNQELSPREQILPTPYAIFAASAASASNFTGSVVQGSFVGNGGGLTNIGVSLQMQVFTSSGTFNVPTNVTSIIIEAWGGGGMGGSGSSTYDVGGGGGGAGGYTKALYTVTPGASYPVSVGAGGTSGQPTGGNTSMDFVLLATGGSPGGSPSSSSGSVVAGGAGGISDLAASSLNSGTKGGTGKYGTPDGGGDGGDAPCGGPGGLGSFGGTPEAGHVPGGGGGGGDFAGVMTGANGGSGEVIVYY